MATVAGKQRKLDEAETRALALVADLRPISLEDRRVFTEAVAVEPVPGWSYYFPYLQLFGNASENERLLYETSDGSIAVYRLRTRRSRRTLSLLVPPFPWNERLLRRGLERSAAVNRDGLGRIARVSEDIAARVARLGLDLRFNMDEYIYDRAAVVAAEGKPFSGLRRKLGQTRNADTRTRRFTADDVPACEALLYRWYAGLRGRGIRIGPYRRYARSCLRNADAFDDLLMGEVVDVDGAVAAFSFGGPIHDRVGSVFVTVSDHDHAGLAYLQRHSLMSAFAELDTFNDGTDSGRGGMKQMKQTFRPIRMHTVYSARTRD